VIDEDLCWLSIAEASELIRTGRLSPIQLTESVLRRIEALEPQIGAFVTLLADRACESARRAERDIAQGDYRGPLHGIPITLKDLINVAGVRMTAGSKAMAEFVSTLQASVAARLDDAGAILLGKVQLDELAIGPTTEYHFGVTRNPWDRERLTWGSSSGSAAAVAAGFGCASIGTDTSGSIRGPAAACGVVGFKPTYGRVSRYGILPLSWTQDCAGPLTRTVRDSALMMNAIAGHDPREASSLDCMVPDFTRGLTGELKGCKIGLPREFRDGVAPEIACAVNDAISVFEDAGAELHEVSFGSLDAALTARAVIGLAEASAAHKRLLAEHAEKMGPNVRTRLEVGSALLATDYIDAQRARSAFQQTFNDVMNGLDVLVMPTSPTLVPRFDDPPMFWSAEVDADRAASDRFRWPFNLTGAPAISVPCGFTSSGLPIGLQIAAKPMADERVLQVSYAYEQRTDWKNRRPTIAAQERVPA
jgi:aspartyl-tRNA(Asn)/glutamyl-tRNA(Gln) amidotransferase subunit A